jgi:hypothetical protein
MMAYFAEVFHIEFALLADGLNGFALLLELRSTVRALHYGKGTPTLLTYPSTQTHLLVHYSLQLAFGLDIHSNSESQTQRKKERKKERERERERERKAYFAQLLSL